MELDVTIYDENDNEIQVAVLCEEGMRGGRDEFGRACEPDDPDTFEILDATRDCKEYILTATEETAAIDAAIEEIQDGAGQDWRY